MVKTFLTFLLSSVAVAEMQMVTECNKKEIYFGQNVTCDFLIVSDHSPVEVEVMKFPEFRGFWSENIALRQGPIALGWPSGPSAVRKGLVGSYIITPILGRANPKVLPMKVSVLGEAEGNFVLESSPPELKIKELPKLPPSIQPEDFIGAVGDFYIAIENKELEFHPDEPISLRIQLQGEGNFAEVNEIPYIVPKGIEILSKRSYQIGGRGLAAKIYDFRMLIKGTKDVTIPARQIYFFNPTLGKYVGLPIPDITLKYSPKVKERDQDDLKPIEIRGLFTSYSSKNFPFDSWQYWLIQCTFLLSAAAIACKFEWEKWSALQATKSTMLIKHRLKELRKLERAKDEKKFVQGADHLLSWHLVELAKAQPSDSVAMILRRQKELWSQDWIKQFEKLHANLQAHQFAPPERRAAISLTEMHQAIRTLVAQSPRKS